MMRQWLTALAALALATTPAAAQEGSPAGAVPAARLTARRVALRSAVGGALVVVRSAEARHDTDHAQDSFFRQDDDFFYLTGLEEAGAVLVGSAAVGWVLYLPERIPSREQWSGVRLGPGPDAARLTGITDVRPVARLAAEAPSLAAGAGADSATLLVGGAAPKACAQRGGACPDPLLASVLTATPGRVAVLAPYTAALRLVKDEDELARLRRAAAITVAGEQAALELAAPGEHEYDLEAAIEAAFRRGGAERVGFPTIVGSGPNSTVLHYDQNRRQLAAGDLVVMDVGAEFGYYTADVTRTIPVSGTFTERQRALYELVLGTQQAVIDAVRPGGSLMQLELVARNYMRAHSGTLCGASCDQYFIHGVSHWLGLDVHDVGVMGTPFQPGMVLTVEPGVYLPAEGLGVRIEDDVLVTAGGHEVLSVGGPKTAAEIEQAMRAARGARAGTR